MLQLFLRILCYLGYNIYLEIKKLFCSGTIKSNIDPFNEYLNTEIIDALKKINIWECLKAPENYEKDL